MKLTNIANISIRDFPSPCSAIHIVSQEPVTSIYTDFYITNETNTFINGQEVCYSIFVKFIKYHEEECCIDVIDIEITKNSEYAYDEGLEYCNICDKVFVTVGENYIPKEVKEYMEDMRRNLK